MIHPTIFSLINLLFKAFLAQKHATSISTVGQAEAQAKAVSSSCSEDVDNSIISPSQVNEQSELENETFPAELYPQAKVVAMKNLTPIVDESLVTLWEEIGETYIGKILIGELKKSHYRREVLN